MASTQSTASQQDNPLANIVLNVLAPVLILNYCSKEGEKFYQLGPYVAMGVAIAIPVLYGVWHFIAKRGFNVFSAVGFFNVLLTGIITIYLYSSDDPEVRRRAPLLFGLKEAIQPLILGSLFLLTHRTKTPLFNVFIYNDAVFDQKRIGKAIEEKGTVAEHDSLLWQSTKLFFGSFLLSAVLNLGLAYYFLGDLDPGLENWKELYNQDVARITGWGFLVIGLPLVIIGAVILFRLVTGLKTLTDLPTEQIMNAR